MNFLVGGIKMIDLHNHILPGLDDGANDIEESLAMAEIAAEDGITMLVATPHVMSGAFDNRKADILQKVKELNQLLESQKIPLQILPGAEYHLDSDLLRRLSAGDLLTINDSGQHLLVELPASMVPDYTGRILYELQLQGITPIIAHPERNIGFEREPELLRKFISRGILTQITSGSITGMFGKSVKKTAWSFLQEGYAHLIASDAHSAHVRSPALSHAFLELERRWGTDYARTLSYENPRLIIAGLPVQPTLKPSSEASWTKFLKKFRK